MVISSFVVIARNANDVLVLVAHRKMIYNDAGSCRRYDSATFRKRLLSPAKSLFIHAKLS
jgi:hypothetical protein